MIGHQGPCKAAGLTVVQNTAKPVQKLSRSLSSRKIFRRSIPRTMMRCSAPEASNRALRGMQCN
jgi:hypothetical protein